MKKFVAYMTKVGSLLSGIFLDECLLLLILDLGCTELVPNLIHIRHIYLQNKYSRFIISKIPVKLNKKTL